MAETRFRFYSSLWLVSYKDFSLPSPREAVMLLEGHVLLRILSRTSMLNGKAVSLVLEIRSTGRGGRGRLKDS